MFERVLQFFSIACNHRKISKPFAAASSSYSATGTSDWDAVELKGGADHYVVCLDCGKKFGYDWSAIRVMK
jgi:hypothetical protein